jgi:hypothetical protein
MQEDTDTAFCSAWLLGPHETSSYDYSVLRQDGFTKAY